jgi:hypothetical protein
VTAGLIDHMNKNKQASRHLTTRRQEEYKDRGSKKKKTVKNGAD